MMHAALAQLSCEKSCERWRALTRLGKQCMVVETFNEPINKQKEVGRHDISGVGSVVGARSSFNLRAQLETKIEKRQCVELSFSSSIATVSSLTHTYKQKLRNMSTCRACLCCKSMSTFVMLLFRDFQSFSYSALDAVCTKSNDRAGPFHLQTAKSRFR